MQYKSITVASIVLLAGCAGVPSQPKVAVGEEEAARVASRPAPMMEQPDIKKVFSLTAERETQAKQSVLATLSDPESAKFGTIIAVGDPAKPADSVACGLVNAKNAYGGYVGFTPFVAVGGEVVIGVGTSEYGLSNSGIVEALCTPNQ